MKILRKILFYNQSFLLYYGLNKLRKLLTFLILATATSYKINILLILAATTSYKINIASYYLSYYSLIKLNLTFTNYLLNLTFTNYLRT